MGKKALIVAALAGFIGGFLTNDIKILQEMGYEVHCAGNAKNKDKNENEKFFISLGTIFHQVDFSSKTPFSKESYCAFKQLKTLITEEKFDLIHCHTPIAGVITRIAVLPYRKRMADTTVIYTSHGFYFHKGSSKKTWLVYYTIEKIMSLFCDAIITINNEDYLTAKKMFCKKVYHINGVGCDTAKYRDACVDRIAYRKSLGVMPDQILILDIGELSIRKNHKVVIDAIAKLKNVNIVLLICGKAISGQGIYDSLKKTAEDKGVNVIFAGHRLDIPEICKCADFGVLASTREGLGMAGIEMMSAGLPLVTSNVHGIKDYMKDKETGFMCEPCDVDAFAAGIEKLCDPTMRNKMKSKCVESAKQFDMSISRRQMRAIYNELLR